MLEFLHLAKEAGMEAAQLYSWMSAHGTRRRAGTRRYFSEVISKTPLPVVPSTHQSVGYRIPSGIGG